jgi:hypothetical protein
VTSSLARRGFILAALGLTVFPGPAPATEVAGVALPERARPGGGKAEIGLRGAGLFQFLFLRYYVCGLYAAQGLSGAGEILAGDAPRRVQLVALKRITSFEFFWGLDKGLKDNTDAAEAVTLRASLEQVRETIRSIGAIAAGTRVSIDYVPGAGTSILVEERPRGAAIAGKTLNDALMRVWIGKHPLDSSLKKALLGAQA